jgi:hypothetical protein
LKNGQVVLGNLPDGEELRRFFANNLIVPGDLPDWWKM